VAVGGTAVTVDVLVLVGNTVVAVKVALGTIAVCVIVLVYVELGTAVIVAVPAGQSYHLTQSTYIFCGNTVVPSGLPGQFPPTARFKIINWFSLNSESSAGVMSITWNWTPSRNHLMYWLSHSIPKMW